MLPFTLAIFNLGFGELMVIGVFGVLLFGNRLPQVARSLGRGVVEFKRGLRETDDEVRREIDDRNKGNDEK